MKISLNESEIKVEDTAYPRIGFGTYPMRGDVCEKAIQCALQEGYRCFDTATMYENFEAVGHALKKANRSDIFVTSKVWPANQAGAKLITDLETTLKALQMDYLDVYLLHWPDSRLNLNEIIENLNHLRERQLVRFVGLSNVTTYHIQRALDLGMPVSVVQNEMSPLFLETELLEFCHQKNILLQSWSPLGRGKINELDYMLELAKKYGKTPSQITLRWLLQHQCLPIPSSSNPQHIKDNFDAFDFILKQEDFDLMNEKAKEGERFRITKSMGLGFTDEFDASYGECWPSS